MRRFTQRALDDVILASPIQYLRIVDGCHLELIIAIALLRIFWSSSAFHGFRMQHAVHNVKPHVSRMTIEVHLSSRENTEHSVGSPASN
jgi:hypothetical protein